MKTLTLFKSSTSLKVGDIILCDESDFSDTPGKSVFDLSIVDIRWYSDGTYHIQTVRGWHKLRSLLMGYDTIPHHRDDRIIEFPKKFKRSGRSVD